MSDMSSRMGWVNGTHWDWVGPDGSLDLLMIQIDESLGKSGSQMDTQWVSMLATPASVVISLVAVLVCGALCWLAISRRGFRRSTVFLEALRLAIVLLAVVVLNQPEWLQRFLPTEEPVVAVLWDNSGSMATEDVATEDVATEDVATEDVATEVVAATEDASREGQTGSRSTVSRSAALETWTQPERWSAFDEKFVVDVQPFASKLAEPSRGTDMNQAMQEVLERHSNLRALIMLTDGNWNTGSSPTQASTLFRMQEVPVFTVAVGSDVPLPDIEATSLDAPTFGVVGKPVRVPFSITSTMPRVTKVQVTLDAGEGESVASEFEVPANGTLSDAFVWSPKTVGDYELQLSILPSEGERILANNSITTPISIRRESLRVLVVEAYPRWEYRFIRNALARDPGVEVKCLLFHPDLEAKGGGKDYIDGFPQTLDELSKFDVIFLGDVGVQDGQLNAEDCRRIRGMVESQATGLILMPGFRGNQLSLMDTELNDLFPVVLDRYQKKGWGNVVPAQIQLTEAGSESLLTKLADSAEGNRSVWRSLPGFQWYAAVERAKVGSQVLAVHASVSNDAGRIPLLVTKTFGAGKILFMGTDGAWRWREGVEDKYHYRFWGQVARWMAYQRNMAGGESMRLFYSPDRPKTGQTMSLSANVMALDGEPLQRGNVKVQIIAPSGDTQTIQLAAVDSEESWGLYGGYFEPSERGEHRAILTCQETGATLEATISVQGRERERLGQPVNSEVLSEVAAISRGRTLEMNEIDRLISEIGQLPEPEPELKRIRLWAHPVFAGLFLLLLAMFWIGRKLDGVI